MNGKLKLGGGLLLFVVGYFMMGLAAGIANAVLLFRHGVPFSVFWVVNEVAVILCWPYALFARIFLPWNYSIFELLKGWFG
jgi:hypothetical protein